MTGRRRSLAVLLAVVAALTFGSGCASIPSSSRPQIIDQSVPLSSPEADVDRRYDEIVPRPGEKPEDIVRDYLRAGGSYERAHARARAYLSTDGNRNWKDVKGAVILEDVPYLAVSADGSKVDMIARQRGRLDEDGAYIPGDARYPYTFRLQKEDGDWRITNPPSGVLIEDGTFEAAYHSYEVYFLNSTRTRVVPDVRWYAAAKGSLSSLLVAAIVNGPSEWLGDAVQSDLEDVTLQSNVVEESDRVKVHLSGLDDQTETLPAGGFAQLVWTLQQVGVGGVEVYSDNRLLKPQQAPQRSVQQAADWQSFSPAGPVSLPAGYFIRDGAVWTTRDSRVGGVAGRDGYGAVSVGVAADERSIAVVRRMSDGSQALYVGAPGDLRRTVTGTTLSRPTWGGGTTEVWTVRNNSEVVVVRGADQGRVGVTGLSENDSIRAVRLSADGTRVALVAGPRGQERLLIGVVVQDSGLARIEGLRPLDVNETPVSDVNWIDPLNVVALVRAGQQDSGLYTVSIDGYTAGGLVRTSGLPAPPTAVAAGPNLPLLTVAASSLWSTPTKDGTWTRALEKGVGDSAPTYPG